MVSNRTITTGPRPSNAKAPRMSDVYIYEAVRTPRGRGKRDGSLHSVTPTQLAAQALAALRDRTALDTSLVDDVVLGCVEPHGEQGGDIARTAAIVAGFAETVTGVQINRFCASGLEALNMAAAKVAFGEADFAIGGGVESLSRVPIGSSGMPLAVDPALASCIGFVPQGISADLIATLHGFSRADVDAFALASQERTAVAQRDARFTRSVISVVDRNGKVLLDRDEFPRPQTTLATLGALAPSFAKMGDLGFDAVAIAKYPQVERVDHVHTAGNSSGIVDGAAAVLVGTRAAGERAGLRPRARIRATATVGSEPTIMLTGPVPAARKALAKAGMTFADIDLFEVNEAFAAVPLLFMAETGVSHDRINVNGGAIALGHPLGATGAMLVGTLLDELERRGLQTGLVTLCVGGGMGIATIVERV
jgi:acetyl-CoA C-acetyltransferase